MILTILFRELRVPIDKNEPKKVLCHTDIYNVQTLHRMGFYKIRSEWIRRDDEQKGPEEGEPSRTISEDTPPSPTRPLSPTLEASTQSIPSSSIQLNEDQMRRIAHFVAMELKQSIKEEFVKLHQLISSQIPRPPSDDQS